MKDVFNLFVYVALVALILYLPRLRYYLDGFKKQPHLHNGRKNRIAVIVPARNESASIPLLLESISHQTYDASFFDTHIIVKSADDPTCQIAARYPHTYVHVIPNQTCKGMALDGGLKEILRDKAVHYDAYAIVDADNVLRNNFVEEMNNALSTGCQIIVGKKGIKNWLLAKPELRSWVTNCSALVYTFIDDMGNAYRTNHGITCTICGTGICVRADVIEQNDGWPYRSITEDFELTANSILHNYSTMYYKYAVTFTEEAVSHKVAWNRRMRWVRGYAQVITKYRAAVIRKTWGLGAYAQPRTGNVFKDAASFVNHIEWKNFDFLYSFSPLFLFFGDVIISFFWYVAAGILYRHATGAWNLLYFKYAIIIALVVYGVLVAYTLIGMYTDRHAIHIPLGEKIGLVFLTPVYMSEFLPLYIGAFLGGRKKQEWKPVERIQTVKEKEQLK